MNLIKKYIKSFKNKEIEDSTISEINMIKYLFKDKHELNIYIKNNKYYIRNIIKNQLPKLYKFISKKYVDFNDYYFQKELHLLYLLITINNYKLNFINTDDDFINILNQYINTDYLKPINKYDNDCWYKTSINNILKHNYVYGIYLTKDNTLINNRNFYIKNINNKKIKDNFSYNLNSCLIFEIDKNNNLTGNIIIGIIENKNNFFISNNEEIYNVKAIIYKNKAFVKTNEKVYKKLNDNKQLYKIFKKELKDLNIKDKKVKEIINTDNYGEFI